jgi:hypothetical protein
VTPLTPSSDLSAAIPRGEGERHDRLDAAVRSLRAERERLARLGFEIPIARCEAQLRYWEFLRAIHALEPLKRAVGE